MLSKIWVVFLLLSVIFGTATHRMAEVTSAVTTGASETVKLMLYIVGIMSLWSGVMEVVLQSGLAGKIERMLRPVLRLLFGSAAKDQQAMEAVSANITANLLGLSNAATPIGLQAAERLYEIQRKEHRTDAVRMLILLNTTSIQLIPTTIAAVRAGYGAKAPYDIMPAVWGASIVSVLTVVFLARITERFRKNLK